MPIVETAKAILRQCGAPRDNPVILDGGCYRGAFAEACFKEFPDARVIGYEPHTENSRMAAAHLADRPDFEIVNAALGETSGRAEFFSGERGPTNSLLPRPSNGEQPYYPATATLSGGSFVEVVTIDEELDRLGIDRLDILKLDLQGGELAALKGAEALLERGGADLIVTEAMFVTKYENQPLLWRTWGFLDTFGYSLFSLEDIKIGPYDECDCMRAMQWNQADAIYLSRELRCDLEG